MPKDEFDPEDPMELNGVALLTDEDTTEAMAECFIEEFLLMGYNHKQLLALFRNPHYLGMNMVLQKRGEVFVKGVISDVFERWGSKIEWPSSAPVDSRPHSPHYEPGSAGVPAGAVQSEAVAGETPALPGLSVQGSNVRGFAWENSPGPLSRGEGEGFAVCSPCPGAASGQKALIPPATAEELFPLPEGEYLFSVVELVALRRVAPRAAAQRLPPNRAARASRSAAARGGVVAARQPLPLNRYEGEGQERSVEHSCSCRSGSCSSTPSERSIALDENSGTDPATRFNSTTDEARFNALTHSTNT